MEINKYQTGKIYAIRSPHTERFYIGSTIQELAIRFRNHPCSKKNISAKEIIAFGDAYIELVESFPCNSQAELHKREGELIRENKSLIVNKKMAGGREMDIPEYQKAYYLANAERLIAEQKARVLANPEKKKAQDKAYREAHKEEAEAYNKAWREANKEKKAADDKRWREANKEKKAAADKARYEKKKAAKPL
jgi:hypothetical protein